MIADLLWKTIRQLIRLSYELGRNSETSQNKCIDSEVELIGSHDITNEDLIEFSYPKCN